MDRLLRFASAAAALAALTGCPAVKPPTSQFPSADAALDRMKATNACVNGVWGDARIDHMSDKGGRVRGQVFLLAVNPDRVRFDVVAFGTPVFTVTSDGKRFEMLDIREKTFFQGPASPCNLARLTQVPLPGHALVDLLRGEAPVLTHQPAGASIAWDADHGFYRVLLQSTREATQEIHLEVYDKDRALPWDKQRVRVTGVRVAQRGIDLYEAELKSFDVAHTSGPREDPDGIDAPVPPSGPACDAELPRTIHMKVASTGDDVVFQYKEAKWNPPLLPNTFRQQRPGGVRDRYVDCER
jgi:hypothetical protein